MCEDVQQKVSHRGRREKTTKHTEKIKHKREDVNTHDRAYLDEALYIIY